MTNNIATQANYSVDLNSEVYLCGPEFMHHTGYDDIREGVALVWCFERPDGSRAGGAYSTHAGASQTAREFPVTFAGARIIPCLWRRDPSGRYSTEKVTRSFGFPASEWWAEYL